MELFHYGCTALAGTNKTGVLKPDADGYYTLVMGGFNVYNSADNWYPYTPSVKALFEGSSALRRRMQNAALKGELGHPRKLPGMTDRDFMARIMDIYEPNVCQNIADLWADTTLFKGRDGQPIVAILGKVKPFGAQKEAFIDALEDPKANACESIRSLTFDQIRRGRIEKEVQTLVTYDHVNEPGIPIANKYSSPALEAFGEELLVTRDMLDQLVQRRMDAKMGLESDNVVKSIILDINSRKPRPGEFAIPLGGSLRW